MTDQMRNHWSMEKKVMDEKTVTALLYRIKQLENNVQRARDLTKEMQLELQAVTGTLEITKYDFENLRGFCK